MEFYDFLIDVELKFYLSDTCEILFYFLKAKQKFNPPCLLFFLPLQIVLFLIFRFLSLTLHSKSHIFFEEVYLWNHRK